MCAIHFYGPDLLDNSSKSGSARRNLTTSRCETIIDTNRKLKQSLCGTLCSLADAKRCSDLTKAGSAIGVHPVLLDCEFLLFEAQPWDFYRGK